MESGRALTAEPASIGQQDRRDTGPYPLLMLQFIYKENAFIDSCCRRWQTHGRKW